MDESTLANPEQEVGDQPAPYPVSPLSESIDQSRASAVSGYEEFTLCKAPEPRADALVVMTVWLRARWRHIAPHVAYYHDRGIDVILLRLRTGHLLRFSQGFRVVRRLTELLDLERFQGRPVMLHTFCGGSHLVGLLHKRLAATADGQALRQRISGQVFDVPLDWTDVPTGIAFNASPAPAVRSLLWGVFWGFYVMFYPFAMRHHIDSSRYLQHHPIDAPILLFSSRADKLTTTQKNRSVVDAWRAAGVSVTWVCYDDVPHLYNLKTHPEEHMAALDKHLESSLAPNALARTTTT